MKLNLLLLALLASSAEAGKGKEKGGGGRGGRNKRDKPAKKQGPKTTTTTTLGTPAAGDVTSSTAAAVAERGKKKGGGGRGRGKGPDVAPIIERGVKPPGDEVDDFSSEAPLSIEEETHLYGGMEPPASVPADDLIASGIGPLVDSIGSLSTAKLNIDGTIVETSTIDPLDFAGMVDSAGEVEILEDKDVDSEEGDPLAGMLDTGDESLGLNGYGYDDAPPYEPYVVAGSNGVTMAGPDSVMGVDEEPEDHEGAYVGDIRSMHMERMTDAGRRLRGSNDVHPNVNDAASARRGLSSINTAGIGLFYPLTCNAALNCDSPSSFSAAVTAAGTGEVTLACGTCYTYDIEAGATTTIGGLNIIGKLLVPTNHKGVLVTPYVFIQGELEMSDTNPISKDNLSMKIVLVDGGDKMFTPADSNAGVTGTPFNTGTRAFLVAGGRLNIRGWDGDNSAGGSDTTWTPVLEMAEKYLTPSLSDIPGPMKTMNDIRYAEKKAITPPTANAGGPLANAGMRCPRQLVNHDFEDGVDHSIWSGGDGRILHHEGGVIKINDIETVAQGFRLDATEILHNCPIIPDVKYLITLRMRINMEGLEGTVHPCAVSNNPYDCPRLTSMVMHAGGVYDDDRDTHNVHQHTYMRKGDVGNYGEWITFSSIWSWTADKLANVEGSIFIIENFARGTYIELDSFIMELPSAKSFAPVNDACKELAINGDAENLDGGGFAPFPWFSPRMNDFQLAVHEETDTTGNVNHFFHTHGPTRSTSWSSPRIYPNSDCLALGFIYQVSIKLRLKDYGSNNLWYYLKLRGKQPLGTRDDEGKLIEDWEYEKGILYCRDPISMADGWTECSGSFIVDEELQKMREPRLEIITVDETIPRATLEIDDVSIAFKSGPAEGLTVSDDIARKWSPSADIHITSTTLDTRDSQVATITEIERKGDGTATLKLDSAIAAVLTEKDQHGMGAEVMVTTRNIIIMGDVEYSEENNDGTEFEGGYLQIFHTPDVVQTIEGVQFMNMGQQGVKNRFSLQFLYTRDVAGTSIARNSFVGINFRCIVLDGVSNATVASNTAYKINGYAFLIGYEAENNSITNNIGSLLMDKIRYGERLANHRDDHASLFEVQNPGNDLIGNVAAGSLRRGFAMSLDWRVRGEDDVYNGNLIGPRGSMRRRRQGVFRGNKAHSSLYGEGIHITNFEQFYSENPPPKFEDMSAYRNYGHGIYVHNTHNAMFFGGYTSDNQWGLTFRYSDKLVVQDYIITGSTRIFKDHTESRRMKLCGNSGWSHLGISMFLIQWRHHSYRDPSGGLIMKNVNITDFDKEKTWYNCMETTPISFDSASNSDSIYKSFDFTTSFENVNIDDIRGVVANGCKAEGWNFKDVVINKLPDLHGSGGAWVSNDDRMKGVLGSGSCYEIPGCMAYCPGLCLRRITLEVEQFGTENWKLKVTNLHSGDVSMIPGVLKNINEHWFSDPYAARRFSAYLPSGDFTAEFIDEGGAVVWPVFVEERWEEAVECAGSAKPGDVTFVKPPRDCGELVRNGQFTTLNSTEPYIHTMYKYRTSRDVDVAPGMGIDGTDALIATERNAHWTGIGQNVDSRCSQMLVGEWVEFSAHVKLFDQSLNPTAEGVIDPTKWNKYPMMTATRRLYREGYENTFYTYKEDYAAASLAVPYNNEDYNLVHGIFRVKDHHRLYWEIERAPDNVVYTINDVSLKKFECNNQEIVPNGNFEEDGTTKFWKPYGNDQVWSIVTGYGGSGNAFKIENRQHYSHGHMMYLNTDCLKEGDRFSLSLKVKFEQNGQAITCDPFSWDWDTTTKCPAVYWYTEQVVTDGSGNRHNGAENHYNHDIGRVSVLSSEDGWQTITGLWTVRDYQAGVLETSRFLLDGIRNDIDVAVDDVSWKVLPQKCEALVMNPSFEDGADYWHVSERRTPHRVNIEVVEGATGEHDKAMKIYNRDHSWRGMRQRLDNSCFVPGEAYVITAMFKLTHSESGEGVTCATNNQWRSNHNPDSDIPTANCPNAVLYGHNCYNSDGNMYDHQYLRFWNTEAIDWDPNGFNLFRSGNFIMEEELAGCNDIYLYIHEVDKALDITVDDLQIELYSTIAPTAEPTIAATEEVIIDDTEQPTDTPTSRPTVVDVTSCPIELSESVELSSGPVMLEKSSALCVLTKAAADELGDLTSIAPVALSYDNGDWEIAAGDYATQLLQGETFGSYNIGSHITLPPLPNGESYYLTSYFHSVSDTDKYARLLEAGTFGTTKAELDALIARGSYTHEAAKAWVVGQFNKTATSHREFFRTRVNQRLPHPARIARSGHPCSKGSRWRSYMFSQFDGDISWHPHTFEARQSNDGKYITIRLNNQIRGVVKKMLEPRYSDVVVQFNTEYEMCRRPEPHYAGRYWLRIDGDCHEFVNPQIKFYHDSAQPDASQVISLPNITSGVLEHIDMANTRGGEYILLSGSDDPECFSLNDVSEETDIPTFGRLPDGSWLMYDPRIKLEENTDADPIEDGGGLARSLTGDATACANAPRTFLNEEECILSRDATACGSTTPQVSIDLTESNIQTLHTLTGQYVYGIMGLPTIDSTGSALPWPCELGMRSRWEIKTAQECADTSMGSSTMSTLVELLEEKALSDTNQLLRDIQMTSHQTCDLSDEFSLAMADAEIIIGHECFKRVHPDHLSVYDFTYWTLEMTHPGNMIAAMAGNDHPIEKWMDIDGISFLHYPADKDEIENPSPQLASHPVSRWENHKVHFAQLGRFGDSVDFVDLPNSMRLSEVAEHFGGTTGLEGYGTVVCGTRGEVANDPAEGLVFHATGTGRDLVWNLRHQRDNIWTHIGVTSPDQLRQRVAWAFSQLLVVAEGAIGGRDYTEMWLNFYDIFTRNVFGNYRDMLREISYHPLMAENLSFLRSKSAAYVWEIDQKVSFADENFAREIMQLFSTGLIKLNVDGTPLLDEDGKTQLAYTNDEIMSFARLWTGFDWQQSRGNVEDAWGGNRIDPMKIHAPWRDKFPKTDMTGGYLGDGYPLCVDLPEKMFLRLGAEYRLLGSSYMPELMMDDGYFLTDPPMKFVLGEGPLKTSLCNAGSDGKCQFTNKVVLTSSLNCSGLECEADTLRVVEVAEGIHYEYVRPACVEQAFYSNPKKVIFKTRSSDSSCANPLLPHAAEACCPSPTELNAVRSPDYLYDVERVLASTANARCQDMGYISCDFNDIPSLAWHKRGYHWTSDSCKIQVKVNEVGQVAIVYKPNNYAFLHPHIDDANRNFFKVYWNSDDYPINSNDVSYGNDCGNGICEALPSGGCLCDTQISSNRVFKRIDDLGVDAVLSECTIGAVDPGAFDSDVYQDPFVTNGVTVYLASASGVLDTEAIFEVVDEYGRTFRFKNLRETVKILNSDYSFRNAPSFMSVLNTEADARDAYYEVEAALDNYFYHDNTAPFIAYRLIQRLTTSNPNPRYVKAVATAFRTGKYDGDIGSGNYGDLSATVAAVLLDKEAASINLDANPFKGSLREPLLRVIALMRGMEVTSADGHPIFSLADMDEKVGMAPHSFPTVFSFYLPEYTPSGSKIAEATLVAPESMIQDMPKVVGLLNGLYSLIKYGLSECDGGFGWAPSWMGCNEGNYNRVYGHLGYSQPFDGSLTAEEQASKVISELATILTSGRLAADSREIIKAAYIEKLNEVDSNGVPIDDAAGMALRLAQQLIVTTPEFHTTNVVTRTGDSRPDPLLPEPTGVEYKAIVYVLFAGGCDSFQMLVPYSCTKDRDMFAEYTAVRGSVALEHDQILPLSPVDNQVCERFAVHPNLGTLQGLFNDGDLMFFANTGVLTKPTDDENYWRDTETQLFAHNWMQLAAQRIDPLKAGNNTGVLGRMRDVLKKQGLGVGAFSIDTNSISLIGEPGVNPSPMILSHNGVTEFNRNPSRANMSDIIEFLNGQTTDDSGLFGELFSDELLTSLSHNKLLYETLNGLDNNVDFPDDGLSRQLSMVSKMIATRVQRGTDADVFYLAFGGWDTHSDVLDNQVRLFGRVDAAIDAFHREMVELGTWDNVVLIQTSDFARTLNPNTGEGTDHAWGGNYFMTGGAVKGGQIAGAYPNDLTDEGPIAIGRGRMVPGTSWEAVFSPIAEWFGIPAHKMDSVFPNRGNFPPEHFFDANDIFTL